MDVDHNDDIERIQSIEVEIEEIIKDEDENEDIVHQVIEIADCGNDNSTNVIVTNENSPHNSEEPEDINESDAHNVNIEPKLGFADSNSKANQDNVSVECADTVILQYSKVQVNEQVLPPITQKGNVQLFAEDTGPQLYNAKGSLVTAPIITKNLPKVFEYLPVYGKPKDRKNLKEFFRNKIREFVGCDLSDNDFSQLEDYCSPEHLKIGKEMVMDTNVPVTGVVAGNIIRNLNDVPESSKPPNLCVLKKNKMRKEKDTKGLFNKKLKYRGVRILPYTQEEPGTYHMPSKKPTSHPDTTDLEPGKDVLYRVRVYRPFSYSLAKDRFTRTRHSVFCCDIILTGRHKLSDLRDRFVCHNDFDMRVDVSNHPDMLPNTKAKEVFPSGFLFINNVFYVDTREGCIDYSEPIRHWASERKLGDFPKMDMCSVKLEELILKLGYPEVYVHQGHCEHVFLFSEVRLLNPTDPLCYNNYPCSTAIAQNQTVYCTTCAEFSAKWIVVGCSRVPFDPAFFCETCFKQYLYKDGQKIGEFKAYSYRGNALNILKPQ